MLKHFLFEDVDQAKWNLYVPVYAKTINSSGFFEKTKTEK